MKKIKSLSSVLFILCLVFGLTACGNSGGSSSTTASPSSSSSSGTPASSSKSGLMGGSVQGTALNPAGTVTTFAGTAGASGSTDGTGTTARFFIPIQVTTDGTNLYVADSSNYVVRKIVIATAQVTTLAGKAGFSGSTDGTGSAARFSNIDGITIDGTNLYVADSGNNTIRKIVIATGQVTTLAGTAGVTGSADGTGSAASFSEPTQITTDGTNLYVTDTNNDTIRKIVIATGQVTTLAGDAGIVGSADGTGAAASFDRPEGITTDGTDLFVVDTSNETIRRIVIATGQVTTMAGTAGTQGATDGTGTAATFMLPEGITSDGTNLFVVDTGEDSIRKIVIATDQVSTIAGGTSGSVDGTGAAASFSFPEGITTDGTSLFVADSANETIRKIQ